VTTISGSLEVMLVSGKPIEVQSRLEVEWFEETRNTYLLETKFTEATDLRDLDRLLVLELMVFRWTQWLAKGRQYDGDMTDDEQLRRNIKEFSDSCNKIKETMGLHKKARDASAADGNFQQWLDDVKRRAKLFGVHRVRQSTEAIVLMKEIFSVTDTFYRADAEERQKYGYKTEADIVKWIQKDIRPRFNALDEYFLEHEQAYWVKDM
jgi:hypothetical protein